MSLLVVGSVAYDTIKTPHGEAPDALGGAAVYFSLAARIFTPVRLVGVVGDDFRDDDVRLLEARKIDLGGLERVRGGKTFRWSGEYSPDMNRRETLSVELNVFQDFRPKVPEAFRDSRFVFLANASPVTQASVLDQMDRPDFVMADTMDLWIQTQHRELVDLLGRIDGLLLNDSEAMLLTDRHNLIDAGRAILAMGPSRVVIKKGEHGSVLFEGDRIVPLPAYPTSQVKDPTGAGDSFAGALMGFLAQKGSSGPRKSKGQGVEPKTFKVALAYGTVVASFTVEDFGVRRIAEATEGDTRERFEVYREFLTL